MRVARRPAFLLCAAVLAIASISSTATAAEKEAPTVITVGEMCGGCVKKITKRFDEIKGIDGVRCSVEKKSVTVVPEQGVRLSPRGLWEVMESIGKAPKKMVSPMGTFTEKPEV